MTRPVHVVGIGAITPLGGCWPETAAALASGACAVRPLVPEALWRGLPCTAAARVPQDFPGTDDRRLALMQRAAREAWRMAAAARAATCDASRVGVFIGAESGRATVPTILSLSRAAGGGARFDHQRFGAKARGLAARIDATTLSPAAVAAALAQEIDARGPVRTLSLACASSAAALVEGARAIRLGLCDVALCGGVGADVDPFMLAGFGKLAALSARGVSAPFDVSRDGFVVGEGAAAVVLSAAPGGLAVEIRGAARTLDAHHLTQPEPRGDGAVRAMAAALREAGGAPVDYIQAHGTSTRLNDEVEALAIRTVFPTHWRDIPVSSVKGALGHCIAGAGALGFLCALEALRGGVLFPTAGLRQPDPACALRHVMGAALRRPARRALVNAFAFGGANASLVLEARA